MITYTERIGVLKESVEILAELHGSHSTVTNLLEIADWILATIEEEDAQQ